jgi:hypothetical protein
VKASAWIALAAAALLAGCSGMTRLAYNNADLVLRKMANDWFDLDAAQSDELKVRMRRFHAWHRANELPQYVAFLRTAEQRFVNGITTDDVAWGMSTARARLRVLAAKVVEEAAPVLATLSPAQISVLEKKLGESNAKYTRENFPADERKRIRAQTRSMAESMRQWTGDLTRDQEARVERFVRAHERYTAMRFEDRVRGQREALALLRQRLPAKELAPRLTRHFTDPDTRRSDEYRREERRWEGDLAKLVVELAGTLSPAQRAHVVRSLESYADDFALLAGEARKAA